MWIWFILQERGAAHDAQHDRGRAFVDLSKLKEPALKDQSVASNSLGFQESLASVTENNQQVQFKWMPEHTYDPIASVDMCLGRVHWAERNKADEWRSAWGGLLPILDGLHLCWGLRQKSHVHILFKQVDSWLSLSCWSRRLNPLLYFFSGWRICSAFLHPFLMGRNLSSIFLYIARIRILAAGPRQRDRITIIPASCDIFNTCYLLVEVTVRARCDCLISSVAFFYR